MSGKSFAVIGLGQFGMTLAKELANADYDVLAIDDKDENIQEIADTVTYAVRADVREPEVLRTLGVQNVDASNTSSSCSPVIVTSATVLP